MNTNQVGPHMTVINLFDAVAARRRQLEATYETSGETETRGRLAYLAGDGDNPCDPYSVAWDTWNDGYWQEARRATNDAIGRQVRQVRLVGLTGVALGFIAGLVVTVALY